jgi:hypothetical protein
VQEIRLNLYWGGKYGVAKTRPLAIRPIPNDPAYDWSLYDRTVNYAAQYGIHVLFSSTAHRPGRTAARAQNVAPTQRRSTCATSPTRPRALQRRGSSAPTARLLPAVREWLAWNEPNNPSS